jgi:hypothetical protein
VGIVQGEPVDARDFAVQTEQDARLSDVGHVHPQMRAAADDPERTDKFVPIRWIKTVDESRAIRQNGLFGNQNSAAKPVSASWPATVARLKAAFGVE